MGSKTSCTLWCIKWSVEHYESSRFENKYVWKAWVIKYDEIKMIYICELNAAGDIVVTSDITFENRVLRKFVGPIIEWDFWWSRTNKDLRDSCKDPYIISTLKSKCNNIIVKKGF